MGWVIAAYGCSYLAYAIWGAYSIRRLDDTAKRAESVRSVLGVGALGCLLIGVGVALVLDLGAQLTVPQLDMLVKAVGVLMTLAGVWMVWYTPHKVRHSYDEKYRGAALLPTLKRAVTIAGVAMGVLFVGGGLLLVTLSGSFTALSGILGAVGIAGAVVAMGAAAVAAIVEGGLKTDARIEAWRERREGLRLR